MAAHYDDYNYPVYWQGREYEHESESIALKSFLAKIPKIHSLMEVGSGYGRLTPLYSYRARKILLVDPSAKLLSLSRHFLGRYKNIGFLQSSLENLPAKLKGKKFDLVVMVRVLHHLTKPQEAILSISQVVRDGGYFVLEFPNKNHWKAVLGRFLKGDFTFPLEIFPSDRRSKRRKKPSFIPFMNYHPDQIKEMLASAGFKVIAAKSVSNVRSPFLKKHLSQAILLSFEKLLQDPFARVYFGPSIFLLCRKIG